MSTHNMFLWRNKKSNHTEALLFSTHNMFSWQNKKNIHTFFFLERSFLSRTMGPDIFFIHRIIEPSKLLTAVL